MEHRELQAVGMDVSWDFVSVAGLFAGDAAPTPMSVSADDGKYMISAHLYYQKDTDKWLIGDEAVFASRNEEGGRKRLTENVFSVFRDEQVKYIEDREYSGEELMSLYIASLYEKMKSILKFSGIKKLVVTSETVNKKLVRFFREIMEKQNPAPKKVTFLSHTEAFAFYVISQKKELWVNDATLFFMDRRRFFCENLTRRKEYGKTTFYVEQTDLSGLIKFDELCGEALQAKADEKFLNYLQQDYRTHIVSSVFFTGEGFFENWYRRSIGEICRKRRAFQGANLYSEGACVSVLLEEQKDWLLYCEGRTNVQVSVLYVAGNEEREYSLIKAGSAWPEAYSSAQFIVDKAEEVQFVFTSPFDGAKEYLAVSLDDFPKRDDKTVCIKISAMYEDAHALAVTVEDMGFGDFFPSSGKIIKKRVLL